VFAEEPAKTRVVVFTGGHGFDQRGFAAMFNALPNITWREVAHPQAHALLKADAAKDYDVLVLYDMPGKISAEAQADFGALLHAGKGLVVLHHSLGSYPDWAEYETIIGGRYLFRKRVVDGKEQPASGYKHDVDMPVKVVNPEHPVTKGVAAEFTIHDETYKDFVVGADVTPLLTTTHPTSTPTIGWTKRYGKSQVVYLELGHDKGAYENPNYRRLVTQAIAFVKQP
jgi:type 1 glutamine amidotransferase